MACMALVKATVPLNSDSEVKTIVDVVPSKIKINNDRDFYGIFNTGFPKRPWASNNRLFLNTYQKYTINSYIINTDTGDITELEYENGSQLIVDTKDDIVLALRRSFFVPDNLVIAKLPPQGAEHSLAWTKIGSSVSVPEVEGCTYKYFDLSVPGETVGGFNAIYLGPKSDNEKKVPLIVWPHGGPHSAFANYFFLGAAFFLSQGYSILLVNYRGSIGFGEDSVHYLLGKVGTADVHDCILAVDTVVQEIPHIDKNQLALCGGSHGGFLVTHLSGQYPDKFKVVVARNPVIDIASMSIISDIPDWCYVEAGRAYGQKGEPQDDILVKMRKVSPIMHAHKVKAPTLLQIGSKDLRVPPHQGNEYYTRLKANGVKVRMNLYDDNHPLGSVPNEMDNILNTLLWVDEHLGRNSSEE